MSWAVGAVRIVLGQTHESSISIGNKWEGVVGKYEFDALLFILPQVSLLPCDWP